MMSLDAASAAILPGGSYFDIKAQKLIFSGFPVKKYLEYGVRMVQASVGVERRQTCRSQREPILT